ncbi:helix-turn-helix domain-containing protein [Ruegeria pomeroyi]|nr:helix-turn-helix domain-containing protein [Ruegeria pomeroyi]
MTTRIGFLLFPGFPMACLTSIIEPLRAANEISMSDSFAWRLVSELPHKVVSSAGITFDPDASLETVAALDYLVLLSAPVTRFENPRTASLLRRIERHGTVLGAISGGVFPLVRSGVVRDERLSVHWCYEAAFAAEFPEIRRSNEVIEISPRLLTASGAAAAFDLALSMIEAALGANVANEVACWFQHPIMRKAGVKQALPIHQAADAEGEMSPLVARAVEIFAENLAAPASIAMIAERLNITPRHLERCFKQATGQNPTGYFRHLRMQAARQIVMYTNDSISDVAAAVGYANAKPLVRHYREAFGLTPQQDRKRINLYRVEGNLPVPSV